MKTALLITALCLAGCVPSYHYVGTGTLAKDQYECRRDADNYFFNAKRSVGGVGAGAYANIIESDCMKARGWTKVKD